MCVCAVDERRFTKHKQKNIFIIIILFTRKLIILANLSKFIITRKMYK